MSTSNLSKPSYTDVLLLQDSLRSKNYAESVKHLLRRSAANRVFDISQDGGSLALDLAEDGFDVTIARADHDVVKSIHRIAHETQAPITVHEMCLRDLYAFREQFDAILCAGNAFSHLDDWEVAVDCADRSTTYESLADSFRDLHRLMRINSLLYIETTHTNEFDRETYPTVYENGEVNIGKTPMNLSQEVCHDRSSHLRTCDIVLANETDEFRWQIANLLLSPTGVHELLQTRFGSITNWQPDCEKVYEGFIARK